MTFGALLMAALFGAQGCVYRLMVQQGNFLQPKDLDRVTVGMTKVQVRALLGTPMVADPFQSGRWDYVYYLAGMRLQKPIQRQFTVFFENDKVVRIDRSDKQPEKNAESAAPQPAATPATDSTG
ncbi:MAG TPA: outer membrane protein assembly factor BamE [Povalibacter sp.]|nr:outer membrane protein assembly factor BamE [Povalibacter sp.]